MDERNSITNWCNIIFFIILSSSIFAKDGWFSISSGSNEAHFGLFFTSIDTGFISMEGGSIIATSDGGENWTNLHLSNNYHPSDIFFLNDRIGWMTADDLRAFKTEDGGRSWRLMTEDTSASYQYRSLQSIYFPSLMTGYSVGSIFDGVGGYFATIIKTTDGGSHWLNQKAGNMDFRLNAVCFINDSKGWIGGEGGHFFSTINGGQDWEEKNLGTYAEINSIFSLDNENGWIAAGGGVIFRTANGGESWQLCNSPTYAFLTSIHFIDQKTGYACGLDGTILKSTDGGQNWALQISGTSENLFNIQAVSENIVYCSGWAGTILKTTNGGVGTSDIDNTIETLPNETSLKQNYPNPFNPVTTIGYRLSAISNVELSVFNILGEKVAILMKRIQSAGEHQVKWDAQGLPGGVYYYRLVAGDFREIRKMTLIK